MTKLLINFLSAIKNGSSFKKEIIEVFYSKKIILLAKMLYKEGLILDFWLEKKKKIKIIIALKLGSTTFNTLKIVSKPSRSLFFSFKDIFKLYEKKIIYIFSTALGYLTGLECKQKRIGGILFFYVK